MDFNCKIWNQQDFTYCNNTFICNNCGCKYSIEDLQQHQVQKKKKKTIISTIIVCLIIIGIIGILLHTLPLPKVISNGFTYIIQVDGTYRIDSCNKNETFIEIPSEIRNRPITQISSKAFENNTKVKTIIIPESITSIERAAFKNCSSLETMVLPFIGGSSQYNTHLSYLFSENSSKDTAASAIPTSLKNIYLLDSCTVINTEAFYKCKSLKNVFIPSSVTSIKDGTNSVSIGVNGNFTTNSPYDNLPFYDCSPELVLHCQDMSENSNWSKYWNYINSYYSLQVNWGVKLKDNYTLSSGSWHTKAEDHSIPKEVNLTLSNVNNYLNISATHTAKNYSSNLFNPGYKQVDCKISISPINHTYTYENIVITIEVTINFEEVQQKIFSKETVDYEYHNKKAITLTSGYGTTNFYADTTNGVIKNINNIKGTYKITSVSGKIIFNN